MTDLVPRSCGVKDSATFARLQTTLVHTLPGFMAAISCGGLSASVTHLLPIFFWSEGREEA